MNKCTVVILMFIFCLHFAQAERSKIVHNIKNKTNEILKTVSVDLNNKNESSTNRVLPKITSSTVNKNEDFIKIRQRVLRPNRVSAKMISLETIKEWATTLAKVFLEHESKVVRRKEILKGFTNVKSDIRNGSALIDKAAGILEDLFERRAIAAENIMKTAEELAKDKSDAPSDYQFTESKNINNIKKEVEPTESVWEKPMNCSDLQRVEIEKSKHFDAEISLETSSIHTAVEVFGCGKKVRDAVYNTEDLLPTFRSNYAHDASLEFQYFCSAQGFLRHYPAASWESMVKLNLQDDEIADVYDCRLRPWYVSAGGAPRDVLILFDASGSMNRSSNEVIAEIFTLTLLNTLTDDDRVNVLRFNIIVESPIKCFNDTLVSANHINTAAMMDALKGYHLVNRTKMDEVLTYAVKFLQKQAKATNRNHACQQAIVLLTDSLYFNYTDLMKRIDPEGNIRIFVLWLHDMFGLRDNSRESADALSCSQDGYFAELVTQSDVTLQVMKILQVLERPLVRQRKHRPRVFSDVYAHIEDPRRGEYHWREKESAEQMYRYKELRKNKAVFLNSSQMIKDYVHQNNLDHFGHYCEGEDLKYRMLISVSIPVFDHTTVENITIQLNEERQRNSTRQYPVNRLLGVAGVDIPIDHLKLLLPFYEIGPGGSLFLLDHRGSAVFHENLKPLLDGDILKPGYRTVDVLDLEQPSENHPPRHYPDEWLKFRQSLVINQIKGSRTLRSKNIIEGGMRAFMESREYHWRRVINHYTAVLVLPRYGRQRAVSESVYTQKLAEDALRSLNKTDFSIHPDWLYCRHVEPHFDKREDELLYFLRRRKDEPAFVMEYLKHYFSPMPPTVHEKTYKCIEKLMARLCSDAIATEQWAREREEPGVRDCTSCRLGSTTAFFTTESGLTRWQQYHATSEDAPPPEGYEWPRGPSEVWYHRAAATPGTLVIHAPSSPVRRMRNSFLKPKPLGVRGKWLTAARTLTVPGKGTIGVAGYHFYPSHLEEVFDATTNFPCAEEADECEPRCDGDAWSCVLVDDGGWIVAGAGPLQQELRQGDGVRQHLATAYPIAMAALLNASVFKLNWIHDYQALCFPYEEKDSAASTITSMLFSIRRSLSLIFQITNNAVSVLTMLWATRSAQADTQIEKEKRRRRLKKDFEREKFETLYDDRVLVNRTKFAACDRSRAIYEFQPAALAALNRPADSCKWPLVAASVEQTNLLLVAVFTLCKYEGRPLSNPLINTLVEMTEMEDPPKRPASRLACWRNRVPLPGRLPSTACYKHDYSKEEDYRQCGPWLPDPIPDASITYTPSKILVSIVMFVVISIF